MSEGTALSKFYSKLAKELEKAPIKQATGEEFTNYLRNRGVKQEELQNWQKAMEGIDGKISKQDALARFNELGDVPLRETKLSAFPQYDLMRELHQSQYDNLTGNEMEKLLQPKYGSEYSLGGAPEHAYEELVLHSPWADKLPSDPSHFTDIPGGAQNIGWLRYHLRQLEGDQPQKLFHLDELQSNRHQAGQKKGYYDRNKEKLLSEKLSEARKKYKDAIDSDNNYSLSEKGLKFEEEYIKLRDEYNSLPKEYGPNAGAPDAPFKGDNWKNLGLRRALLEAAERDADLFSWTTGKMQQQRWMDRAGEGTERFYDKDIPNILSKELKAHGITPESFLQIPDPSNSYDVRELSPALARMLAQSEPDASLFGDIVDEFTNSPSAMRANFVRVGMPPERAVAAADEISNFQRHLMTLENPDDEMEAMNAFAYDFVPNYFTNLDMNRNKLPAVRLTPEIRKSILKKGFPKYMLPLGAAGLPMEQEPVQEYAGGGAVKKAMESLFLKGSPGSLLNEVGGMEVLKNPSYKDLLKLAMESDESMDIGEKAVRVLKSPDGDLYSWPSAYLDHQSIADEILPGFDIYGNDAADNFILRNGKLKSYLLGEEHGHDSIPEELNAERLKKFLYSLMAAPALGVQDPEQSYASGGKVGPAAAYDESSESLETALRSLMDAYTLAQSDEMMGGLGAAYAKMMRPELFDDIDYSTLADAAAANSEAERHRLEEEHPVASIAGMIASVPAYASLGGASLLGQMGANAGLGAAYRYGDHEDPLDPTSVGIDLALPVAFRNIGKTIKLASLGIPSLTSSDTIPNKGH